MQVHDLFPNASGYRNAVVERFFYVEPIASRSVYILMMTVNYYGEIADVAVLADSDETVVAELEFHYNTKIGVA